MTPPVLFYYRSGIRRDSSPAKYQVAHWKGHKWMFHEVTKSTHNYDMGSLYIEAGGQWRIIAPTESGPQLHGTGGEIALWKSDDQGQTWKKTREITRNSVLNHGYVRRPVNAHPDFYAFWADGNPDKMSKSWLYFTNKAGSQVWRLPYDMENEYSSPASLLEKQ